ncbi:MAG: aromatic amino acid lyase, partial [Deltaproteobacteria bacterium]|nr:aromatic amino acid lyase [Deltaproteobacteria bacterium]
ANCLAEGYSGCRTDIILLLCEMINKGVTPVLPSQGSVGACGDLAPLAHIAKVLIGDGEVWYQGEKRKSSEIFKKAGLVSVTLEPKEGLSLVNGTHFSLAIACDVLVQAEKLLKIADITGAFSVEGDLASFHPFDEALLRAKPHLGAIKTGNNLRKMLAGSEINLTHKNCNRVQDPYSLRCMPQVHGAAKDAFSFVKNILETELNSSTDNPLVFTDTKKIISGGNFHGESIAMAMDFLSIALAELGSISERRVALLTDPIQNEIPTQFLIPEPGIHSGFMIPQVVMSALVSENKTLAHPASVDSIPTSAGQEDHISMSSWAARKAKQIANNVERILGIELLAGAQAIDSVSKGKKCGKGVSTLHHYIRKSLPVLKEDKHLSSQLQIAYNFVETGVIIDIVEKEIGSLDI